MTEVVVKEIDNEEPKEETIPEPIQEEAPKEEEKPEEIIEPSVEEKPQPAPKPKRVRPSRAKPPFDPEAFKSDLVKQIKEELQSAMSARDTYNKAKEEKNKATREKLKSLASKKNYKVLYIKMNIKEQKIELNKTDIYENVRKDINRRQTVHSNKSANYRSGTPEMPDRRKKVYSSYNHYYHNDSNTARMPTHNHHLYLKRLLEYHNTEHDYKVLQVEQRMKEENEMLQNEMTRLREVRKSHRLEDYGANVQNMKQRIDEYKQWLRGDTQD